MTDRFRYGLFFTLLLVAGVFFAGCSDQASDAVPPVPTTVIAAKYSAGDIIAKSSSATDSMLYVILGYDSSTDQYERAWIYKNSDGSWGHRIDTRTEKSARTLVEKVYPVKVSKVTVASVPVVTTAVPTVTPVTYSGNAPLLTSVSPTTGTKTASASVTLTGQNFQNGAVVKLVQPGVTTATATGVSVTSPTTITCTFSLGNFEKGSTNLIVWNPDGQSASLPHAFTIVDAVPIVSSASPSTLAANSGLVSLTVNGQNFKNPVKVLLIQGASELVCLNPVFKDATKVTCDMNVPAGTALGDWSLTVTNIADQQKGTWPTPFRITNST